jgi:uncharacterized protein (DUF305 family)
MAFCKLVTTVAPILLSVVAGAGQTIVQPGAPGHEGKVLTPAGAAMPPRAPAKADIEFMQGMIHHHSQAVEMTALMPTHTKNKKLLALGQRISISQTDEMKFMKQWLQERGQPAMAPMDDMDMEMPLMPGMLTKQQMEALAKAKGSEFDRLFLTGMIQHHGGALTMVDDLFAVPATGQDPLLFDFVTDVDNTQSAEIRIMQGLLKEKQ